MLNIQNLSAKTGSKEVIQNLSLRLHPGETHIIMGPNGAGKSSLVNVLAGNDAYNISKGSISYKDKDLIALPIEIRSKEGLFVAFQNPIEIEGLNISTFLKAALNEKRKYLNLEPFNSSEFLTKIKAELPKVRLGSSFLSRNLGENMSGGEKKRLEILQMLILDPDLIILDEIDSGLDIDSIKLISATINNFKQKTKSLLIITHYLEFAAFLEPDYIHILTDGQIIKTGGLELLKEIQNSGYGL